MLENQFYQDFGSLARVLKYAYSVFFFLIYFTTQPVTEGTFKVAQLIQGCSTYK